MRSVIIVVFGLVLAGCATAHTAEYLDLKTGQTYVCYRQAAFGAIPAVVANNSYADCKNMFEGRGFIRRDARTDAILKHVDPKLGETLTPLAAPPSTSSASDEATQRMFCRNRTNQSGYTSATGWSEHYWRCMAGY